MSPRAAAALLLLLAACGGSGSAGPSPSPSASPASPSPTASASRTATPTPTRTTASPTASPAFKGSPMTTTGAYLRLARDDQAVANVAACEEAYPDLLDVSCDDVAMDGGSALWVAGTAEDGTGGRRWTLRLHAFVPAEGGYVLRYQADDPTGEWGGFRIGPARLTGYGVDALVVQVTYQGTQARRGYDILTWRKGGPLVLRAHRPPAPQLRVVARESRLDDYEAQGERFVYRQVRWDGTRFLSGVIGTVSAGKVPPPG